MSFVPTKLLPAGAPDTGGVRSGIRALRLFEAILFTGFAVAIATRLKRIDLGLGIAAGTAFLVICIALLFRTDEDMARGVDSRSVRLIVAAWTSQLGGLLWMFGFGAAGLGAIGIWGYVLVAWGVGVACCPVRDTATQLAVAPAVGIAVTMLSMTLVGSIRTLDGNWLYAGVGIILVSSIVGTLDKVRLQRRGGVPPRFSAGQTATVIAAIITIAVGVWVTLLPYGHFRPAVPLGRDFHHLTNTRAVLETGKAQAREPEIAEVQPDTFGYGSGVVARVARVDVLTLFKVLPTLLWGLSALSVFFIARALFSARAALFSVLAYGFWSYQPRQTLADGSMLGIVAENLLLPAALFAMLRSVQRPSFRSTLLTGGLVGATIQFHFLSTTRLIAVAMLFFLLTVLLLPGRGRTLRTLALTGLIGFVLGLPYSIRYSTIYAKMLYAKATGGVVPAHDATLPRVDLPRGLGDILGSGYFLIGLFAIGVWVCWSLLQGARNSTWLWSAAWVAALMFGAITRAFVAPERDVRTLAFPVALLIGWALTFTVESFGRWRPQLIATTFLGFLTLMTFPAVSKHAIDVGGTSIYATQSDMRLFESLHLRRIEGRLGIDESGLWAQWFVTTPPVVVNGGPEGFKWYGEPIRSRMQTLYEVLQRPCASDALKKLGQIGITHLYLGPPPQHWTHPGYNYISGAEVAQCTSNFRLIRHDPSVGAWLLRVKNPGSTGLAESSDQGEGPS